MKKDFVFSKKLADKQKRLKKVAAEGPKEPLKVNNLHTAKCTVAKPTNIVTASTPQYENKPVVSLKHADLAKVKTKKAESLGVAVNGKAGDKFTHKPSEDFEDAFIPLASKDGKSQKSKKK